MAKRTLLAFALTTETPALIYKTSAFIHLFHFYLLMKVSLSYC